MLRPGPFSTICLPSLALLGCASQGLDWQDSPAAREAREQSELRRYKESFTDAMGREFDRSASRADFLAEVEQHPLLLLGDNHRDTVLHQHHVDLLLQLHDRAAEPRATNPATAGARPLCLLLECVGAQDQKLVDEYLAGERSLVSLRERIADRWSGSWFEDVGLDASHYTLLLQFARANRWPVVALEPTPRLPLRERDPRIAATIDAAAARFPTRRLVAIVGQSHLLGEGDLVGRTTPPSIAVGAGVSPHLRGVAARDRVRADFLRTDAGLWFFGDHLPISSRDGW